MAQINIADTTRDRINLILVKEKLAKPELKITQDYIIKKGLDLMEAQQ